MHTLNLKVFIVFCKSEQKFKEKMSDWLEEKTTLKIRIEACNKELQKLSDRLAEFEEQVKSF